MKRSHQVYDAVKRILDLLGAAVLLLVLSPLLLAIGVAVRIVLGSPVLFIQQRPGRHGVLFPLYKFRTMTSAHAGGDIEAVATDDLRLTPLGRLLRSTSLDELPQLWNVLVGHMSFVGPRPLLAEYLPLYNAQQARRHEVRPGITGWAQVNGRNAITWDERFAMDVWYVDNRSLRLDLTILWRTVATVFKREGIATRGHATMEPFAGNSCETMGDHS